jgi:hypothetical protein
MMQRAFAAALLAALTACGSGSSTPPPGGNTPNTPTTPAGLNPAAFSGTWTGSWNNATFGSTGPARAVITTDTATRRITFSLDLDGQVFGLGNPPAETFAGTYDTTRYTVTGPSATFGTLTLNVAVGDGAITGSATPPRGSMTLTGSTSETRMTINYTIRNPGSADIIGTFTLTKQ